MFSIETAIYALLLAFTACVALCPIVIPYLAKLKFGQTIRDDGPKSHLSKAGTPTMGGAVIVLSFCLSLLFFVRDNPDSLAVMFMTLGYAVIGFIDDYIKIIKKRSLGLRAWQKIAAQLVVACVFAIYLSNSTNIGAEIYFPFLRGVSLDLGVWFYPFVFFVMIATVNGVNLTDGLDGLAGGVTALAATFFLFAALLSGSGTLPAIGAAIGALLGFLLFNSNPARVFMGDTGSLALGGFIGSVALLLKMPLMIVIVGFVYVVESVSVILQVVYFKITKGGRLFKMAPIHHHFELCGWPETKIVTLSYIVTAIACLVGYLSIY
jgi:phospho-N-acetylmuramoyl-pentapeptide-transferase